MNKKITSERVIRELTADEKERLTIARRGVAKQKNQIMEQARTHKKAWQAMRCDADRTLAALKQQREQLGLTLADVEVRCGLKRSALSRLENDPMANPTLLTLQRYASALGMAVVSSIKPST